MSEPVNFSWKSVFLSFSWILGLAVILAVLSYYLFLTHRQKLRWKEIISQEVFRKAIHLGLILVTIGLAGSIQNLYLIGFFGVSAFLLMVSFFRQYLQNQFKKHRDEEHNNSQ
jgi:hypothetical protein